MQPYVAALTRLGVPAQAVEIPKGQAERAVPSWLAAVPPSAEAVAGGRSYGARVASLAAANATYAGLVLISYPLHAPGRPETAEARTAHWPEIRCPVLILSGEADPFARIGLLRDAIARLAHAELVSYPGGGHGLLPQLDDVAARIAAFVRLLE